LSKTVSGSFRVSESIVIAALNAKLSS
jgi:hypothetical protein